MIRLFPIRCLLLLSLVSAWVVASPRVVAQEETPEAEAGEKGDRPKKGGKKRAEREAAEKALTEEAVKGALPDELTANFPIGRIFKGVAIPSYTDDALKSVMTADSVIRVDEQYLDLVNLIVHVYNDAGEPETTISMDEASYDLVIGELASKTPSRIEQPRFTMTGDKMTFQAATRVARLIGNVKVIVPDVGELAPGFGIPGAAAKPAPGTP
jgi:hypothetical protein